MTRKEGNEFEKRQKEIQDSYLKELAALQEKNKELQAKIGSYEELREKQKREEFKILLPIAL